MNEETATMDEVIEIFELKVSGVIGVTRNEEIKIVELMTNETAERAMDE